MKTLNNIIALFLISLLFSFGIIISKDFKFQREIKGVEDNWHKIVLPLDIYSDLSEDLSDIRILGITENEDTIEAPYLLKSTKDKTVNKNIEFEIINRSFKNGNYYYTFKPSVNKNINQIKLDFERENFDWKVDLEGSNHQNNWFNILENYRVVGIKNSSTNFNFTVLDMPISNYNYYRLKIKSEKDPELNEVSLTFNEVEKGEYRDYIIKNFKVENSKKETVINTEFSSRIPVSKLKLIVKDTFDYYRPIHIKYPADSFKTEKGWKYSYSTLQSSTLNSLEENEFKFMSTVLNRLKIVIKNYDNEPLNYSGIKAEGYYHELIARFTKKAKYYLVYGNKDTREPNYDIKRFSENIPENISDLDLGKEEKISSKKEAAVSPLFEDELWLWAIMLVIIILIGIFTMKMLRSDESK